MNEKLFSCLETLLSVGVATLDETGLLLKANAGFLRLLNLDALPPDGLRVGHFFIQPAFSAFAGMTADAAGEVFNGLLTLGEYAGQTRSLRARVWRESNHLHLLAEYDIAGLEQLNSTVLQLNRDYAKAQFEIVQVNLKLKQREAELEHSLAQLEAANRHLNAARKKLVEVEKMAALGIMVAGVAHEINTPLGVSLGSASLLEDQSRILAQHFGEQSMTRSELDAFLRNTQAETGLLRGNLERIGHLTDSFHRLAIGDQTQGKSRFGLRRCIDDVLASMGESLLPVKVHLVCDPALEIESFHDDWAAIFSNLVNNSLRHGFKGREGGNIKMTVGREADHLCVDYADDGAGFSEQTRAHIFDPFFTTDMQHGMGLGMHLVYNLIAQKFHGSIRCDSVLGQGAHFHIEVPFA